MPPLPIFEVVLTQIFTYHPNRGALFILRIFEQQLPGIPRAPRSGARPRRQLPVRRGRFSHRWLTLRGAIGHKPTRNASVRPYAEQIFAILLGIYRYG